jgi:hypothetical protein
MKIMEPGGHAMTPQAQLWAGVVLALMFLCGGIGYVAQPTNTLDWLGAIFMLAGASLWLIFAWLGYRRKERP